MFQKINSISVLITFFLQSMADVTFREELKPEAHYVDRVGLELECLDLEKVDPSCIHLT